MTASGASRSGAAWTEEQARQGAVALLATAGMTDPELTLLRFGNSSVYRVDQRYVLRVARPDTLLEHLKQEVRIANELTAHDVSVVSLADVPAGQPFIADNTAGTLWDYLPGAGQTTHAQLGSLLRSFHQQTDSLTPDVPSWQPLASARRRLDALHRTTRPMI